MPRRRGLVDEHLRCFGDPTREFVSRRRIAGAGVSPIARRHREHGGGYVR